MCPHVVVETTKSVVNSGEWLGVRGQVFDGLELFKAAEVWLLVNGRYVKCLPQTSWHERFWFHVRLGLGRYLLQVVGYKLMKEVEIPTKTGMFRRKKEYIVKSKILRVLSIPKIINPNRMLPRAFEIENWRRITLGEAIKMSYKAAKIIVREYPDTSNVCLVGGSVKRGWTRRDIDLLVDSRELLGEGGPAVLGWPSAVKSIRLEGEIEKAIAYPTTVFAYLDKDHYSKEKIAWIYPRTKYPATTTFRPQIKDGCFVLYHGTNYRKARSIQFENKLVTKDSDNIHFTDDKKYAIEWARIRMREKRELGRSVVVTVKVSQDLLPMFRRREPTSRNILYDGRELPVEVVKIDVIGWR